MAGLPGRPDVDCDRHRHAMRRRDPDVRKNVRVADVLRRQADLDGRPHRAVRSASRDRGRPEPAARRADDLPDIRAGMAMLLAAVAAEGTSTINNADQIERGYERIEERLNALGAKITRVPARDGR